MNQEDIVSMGTTAARKARMILKNTHDVLADEPLALVKEYCPTVE